MEQIKDTPLGWFWEVEHWHHEDGKSELLYREIPHNTLVDEGEQNVLDLYFRGQNAPNNFKLGLTSTTLSDTSTLANAVSGEPVQAGYARLSYARDTTDWPTLEFTGGDYRVSGLQKSVFAEAAWSPVIRIFLTSNSVAGATVGPLLLYADLSTTRSLVSGDELKITPRIVCQ